MIYQKLQLYSEISQRTQRKKELEVERRTMESIWETKRQDNKSTSTCSSKERRKILSRNKYIRTCYRRSFVIRTGRKIEVHCIFIKNNAISRMKLWNLWQRITCNCRNSNKMKTILTGCHQEIGSLDRSWESQIFQRTTQAQWKIGKMVFEVTKLWLHTTTYSWKDKHQSRCFIKKGPYWYQGWQ